MADQQARPGDPIDQPIYWEPSLAFLNYTIGFMLAGSAAFLLGIFVFAPDQVWRAASPVAVALVGAATWVLVSRGRLEAAVHMLAFGLWAVVTGIAWFNGGVAGTITLIYPLIILMAGWLIGTRVAVAIVAMTVVATFVFVLAESRGLLPVPPPTPAPMRWVVQSVVAMLAVVMIVFIVRSYRRRLEEVRTLDNELALRTAEVQAREADLNRAQSVAHVGSWVYDIATGELRLSAETCRIFGIPEGSRGSHASHLARIHPEDRIAVDAAWKSALNGGAPLDVEHRILAGDTVRWVRTRAQMEFGADGAPLRSVGTTQDITERKRVDEALRASEVQLQCILGSTVDGILAVDGDGKVIQTNRRFAQLWRIPQPLLDSGDDRALLEHVVGQLADPDAFLQKVQALYQSDAAITDSVSFKDGRIFERFTSPLLLNGSVIGRVWSFRDITEHMRAQQALRDSEERYRTLFANSNVAMLLVDPAGGGIVDANAAACEFYGWDLAALRSKRIDDINTLSADEMRQEMERARSRKRRHFDFRHRLANGTVCDVEVFSGPVKIDGRELLLSIVQDVTERRRAQEELKKSVVFRELLLEAMPLPVFYKDTSGCYIGCNSAFASFVGKPVTDIVGKSMFDVWPRGFAQTYRDKDMELLDAPLVLQTYESRVPHADGTVHDVISHKALTLDEAGRPSGIIGVITDITEIRRMEAARDKLEVQLRESQKMEALGTLAGGVAHDFNNILAAIIGNVELARQDVGPAHAALESLDEIRKASRRAKELVQQILAFGRRQVLARRVISLAPVVEESARLLRTTLPAGISLSVECAPDAPAVLADATQIEQVILNLCNNAWHAIQARGRPGAIEIRLGAREHAPAVAGDAPAADAGGYACLTVHDNGTGMDQETQARIFEPFFTTKPVGSGTGLGLAVVHGIVQEHRARIEVCSVPGEGTSFGIYFPAAQEPAAAAAEVPEVTPKHGQGRHIAYIDDDEAIVFLMTRLLERQGYRVSGFVDAKEALVALRADPGRIDLVVTDFNMPGMSELEVARALREIRADLPIAVASGYITEELRTNAPGAGVSELIYKPNTVDELCEAVARLASARGGRGASS